MSATTETTPTRPGRFAWARARLERALSLDLMEMHDSANDMTAQWYLPPPVVVAASEKYHAAFAHSKRIERLLRACEQGVLPERTTR